MKTETDTSLLNIQVKYMYVIFVKIHCTKSSVYVTATSRHDVRFWQWLYRCAERFILTREHESGVENGAERAENRISGSDRAVSGRGRKRLSGTRTASDVAEWKLQTKTIIVRWNLIFHWFHNVYSPHFAVCRILFSFHLCCSVVHRVGPRAME